MEQDLRAAQSSAWRPTPGGFGTARRKPAAASGLKARAGPVGPNTGRPEEAGRLSVRRNGQPEKGRSRLRADDMTANRSTVPCGVHFTLQGKGGVGKSLVAAIIAQYFQSIGAAPTCIDTDPVNQTLVNYKALNASHLPLMAENSSRVDERKFDDLMEQLLSKDEVFVVDNGSASFIPLSNYLLENDALHLLKDAGCDVFIHVIITGGQALLETLEGFRALAAASSSQNIVVWLNEYFGPIELDGKKFVEMKVYKEHAAKVRGTIRIQERNADTFGKDIQVLAKNKLTFEEALTNPDWQIMARQRIRTVQRDLFDQLDAVRF